MIVRAIKVYVKNEFITDFEKVTIANRAGSIQETGVLRFDILKSAETDGEYFLYEVYSSEEATLKHKETDHYKIWKETVKPMMASPRTSAAYMPVSPTEEPDW
jgi:(4S)-4-hydroxy-5-phosphonooxypentane-2,3-dione isomerase